MTKFKELLSAVLVMLSLTSGIIAQEGQNMRFPQNKNYGLKPTGSTGSKGALANAIRKQYNDNYLRFWRTEGSGAYIYSPATHGEGATTSEAHGFGMMITAIMGDKEKFDKLVTYYESKKTHGNLMDWLGGWGGGAALDGDMDIAFGFLLAEKQWPGNGYLAKSLLISDDIWSQETNGAGKTPRCGTGYTNTSLTRPSDWMGSHFRAFDVNDNGSDWTSIANACYNAYNDFLSKNSAANTTGLISDFVDGGYPANGNETAHDYDYFTNACRVPMRLAMDYVTTAAGKSAAAPRLTKILNWLSSKTGDDASKIAGGYKLDGTAISSDAGLEYVASFGAGLVATSNQTFMDNIWNHIQEPWLHNYENGDSATAYGEAIATLSMLVMTGNFWKPTDNDTYVEEYVDTNGVTLDHFGNSYGDDNAQAHIGACKGVSWGDEKFGYPGGDTTYFVGGSYWYGYAAPDAVIKDADGGVIFDEGDNLDAPTDKIVTDNKLNITFDLKGENNAEYDYAGIGVALSSTIIEEGDSAKSKDAQSDLSNLTAITVRYKSNGKLRMTLETERVSNFAAAQPAGSWVSDFGWFIPASPDSFTRVEFKIEDMKPENGALLDSLIKEDAGTWSWTADGNVNKVAAFGITASEEADKGSTINLQIEEIILVGMKYTDFGINYREPNPIPVVSTPKSLVKNSWNTFIRGNTVALKFNNIAGAKIEAFLYNAMGKMISNTKSNLTVGKSVVSFDNVNLSNGRYFVKVKVGDQVSTSAFNFVK